MLENVNGQKTNALGKTGKETMAEKAGTDIMDIEIEVSPGDDVPTLENFADEDDKPAEADNTDDEMAEAWKLASNSYIRGMWNIRNVLNDSFYAAISENDKQERTIEFCQKYNSGSFSPKMSVLQADMILAVMSELSRSNGDGLDPSTKRFVSKFFLQTGKEYLGKFRGGPGEAFSIKEIMMTLYMASSHLPTVKDDAIEWNRREFYKKLAGAIRILSSQVINEHPSYYVIAEDELTWVAQEMKMAKQALLKKLKDYGLLRLTQSSRGYQCNVRFRDNDGSTYTAWMYCVFNMEYIAGKLGGAEGGKTDKLEFPDF